MAGPYLLTEDSFVEEETDEGQLLQPGSRHQDHMARSLFQPIQQSRGHQAEPMLIAAHPKPSPLPTTKEISEEGLNAFEETGRSHSTWEALKTPSERESDAPWKRQLLISWA